MKNFIILVSLFLTSSLYAQAFDQFVAGLQKDYYMTRTDRGIELNHHIRVSKFGPLGRILSPDATATYNSKLNLISLQEDLLIKNGRQYSIKDARLIRGANYAQTYYLSTIFHEMGHAELDVFIENEREAEDSMLLHHYKNVLKPFYKSNFPKFNPFTIFHEHFGYYRSDLLDFLTNERGDVLLANGYNVFSKSCFLNSVLRKKLADGISLEEFQKLFVINTNAEPYRKRVSTRYVYVKGKDIDLIQAPLAKGILEQTHTLFWAYHQAMYGFPINQKDLVNRMNATGEFKASLSECRTRFWNEAQARR